MPNEPRQKKSRQIYPAIFLVAGIYIFISSFSVLSPILLAFLLTVLMTLALNPLIFKLRHLSGGRTVAIGMVLITFLAIAGLTGWAFYKPMKRSTTKFVERLPRYWERIQKPIMKMEQKAVITEQRLKQEVKTEVAKETKDKTNSPAAPTNKPPVVEPEITHSVIPEVEPLDSKEPPSGNFIRTGLGTLLVGITGSFKSFASDAASLVLVVVTVFFGVIFTLIKPHPMIWMFYALIPAQHHPRAKVISQRIVTFVPRWASATLLGMTIIGVMIFLAMWPLFSFQDALVLGLIAMVFEAVPYIGPILASLPALLLAAGDGGFKPLWVLLAYAAVQAIENNLIMPVVVGGQLRLHPVAVIFSVLLCVATFGVLGVLIAMPMLAIIMIFHEEIYRPRFLPQVSDEELNQLAQATLENKPFEPVETTESDKTSSAP